MIVTPRIREASSEPRATDVDHGRCVVETSSTHVCQLLYKLTPNGAYADIMWYRCRNNGNATYPVYLNCDASNA